MNKASGGNGIPVEAGRDWGQEEKGTTEEEMAGWHHWLDGHEFEWTPGAGDGHGGLACCNSWGRKESDMTERLNWTELSWYVYSYFKSAYQFQQKIMQRFWLEFCWTCICIVLNTYINLRSIEYEHVKCAVFQFTWMVHLFSFIQIFFNFSQQCFVVWSEQAYIRKNTYFLKNPHLNISSLFWYYCKWDFF